MLERILKSLAVILASCLILPGCAHFTKSGRQQLAYQKYVRKCSYTRDRQRSKMKTPRASIPASAPSDNKVSADVVNAPSPQSVTAGDSQSEQ
ncbi:MAG TPA: hypothetical protein DCO65_00730 [Spartobacteria bacterium]|jgi:hypothetical protein|nr:hypothetical protein [Spartobacteria bacterium]HAK05790.1 hypothetical protein [Spartobacteria bacterium]HCP90919.1 hypothetical protein [Spartobacteria bacterium]